MVDTHLVPPNTVASGKADGSVLDISSAGSRIFLLNLRITNIVEQESLDVTIFGSADGTAWGAKPLAAFPQKFYRGEHPLLLDLTDHGDVKFLRPHWEAARWGRGTEVPMFEFDLSIKEVPSEILQEAAAEAKAFL